MSNKKFLLHSGSEELTGSLYQLAGWEELRQDLLLLMFHFSEAHKLVTRNSYSRFITNSFISIIKVHMPFGKCLK